MPFAFYLATNRIHLGGSTAVCGMQASVFNCFTVKAKAGELTPFGVRNSVIAMAALPSPDLTAQLLNLINLHRCLPAPLVKASHMLSGCRTLCFIFNLGHQIVDFG